jgi:hypothetical protein
VRLCLDEMYSPQIASDLRDLGHDVTSVKERPELVGLTDTQLLAVMAAEQRALLTENVQDFAPLVRVAAAAGESHYGMIYSSNKTLPRSKATIGVFVRLLATLIHAFPGDEDFRDRVEWLQP